MSIIILLIMSLFIIFHRSTSHLILEKSNFYSESGGQESDRGCIKLATNYMTEFDVLSISDKNGYIIHTGVCEEGKLHVGEDVVLLVDSDHRGRNIVHHTATHLLNSSVRQIMDVPICQKSSNVTSEELKLELTVYGVKIKPDTIEKIEKDVRSMVFSGTPISTRVCNLSDKSIDLNEVTVVPGEVYPEKGVRLVSVGGSYGRNLLSNEFCCGTHATNTDELVDFCITNVKMTGNNSYSFYAIAGESAAQAHHRGEQILKDVMHVKQDMENQKEGLENNEARVLRLKNVVLNSNMQIPHCVKLKCIEILNDLTRMIKDHTKKSLREVMDIEMRTLMDQKPIETHKFIVHFLESSSLLKDVQLHKATRICTNRPIIVLSLTNGKINARCCVPEPCINENFNASKWMSIIAKIFESEIATPKGQDPDLVCNIKVKKVSQATVEAQIELALNLASKFAEKYMR